MTEQTITNAIWLITVVGLASLAALAGCLLIWLIEWAGEKRKR